MSSKPCCCPRYEWEYSTDDLCNFNYARAILLRLWELKVTASLSTEDYQALIDVTARRICPSEQPEQWRKEWCATLDRAIALMIAA